MKWLFLSIQFVFVWSSIFSQVESHCDTIVLQNGQILSVDIRNEDMNVLHCTYCPPDQRAPFDILRQAVCRAFSANGLHGRYWQYARLMETSPEQEVACDGVWQFWHRYKKKEFSIASGQEIIVRYNTINEKGRKVTRNQYGSLLSLSANSLHVLDKQGSILQMDEHVIREICINGTTRKWTRWMAWIMAAGGFVWLMTVVLSASVSYAGSYSPADKDHVWSWLTPMLVVVGGLLLFRFSDEFYHIEEPFRGDWEIHRIDVNSPGEVKDIQELPRP
ncbi:MAG: hypothetical protein K9I85_15720 [Saprospiraceae bacterium]|nr:hypothetical protein [Saprospiraceae bacterium]